MEITNDIKAKLFGQYLGQMVLLHKENEKIELTGYIIGNLKTYNNFDNCSLILNPLSKLSYEDATEMAMLIGENHLHIIACFRGQPEFNKQPDQKMVKFFTDKSIIYQFLQNNGYDLPQNILGGKTLQEAGLAIYE